MASSLFGNPKQIPQPKQINASFERQARQLVTNVKNNRAFQMAAMQDPEINAFIQKNKGKSLQQLSEEYGVDYNLVRSLIK